MRVDVKGLASFVNRLEKFDQDVSKTLKAELKSASSVVAGRASGLQPNTVLSNWGRWIDSGTMPKSTAGRDLSYAKRGYKVKTNRYRNKGAVTSFGMDVESVGPGAGILEFVGSQNRTPKFSDPIVSRFGPVPKGSRGFMPRILLPAYYMGMSEAAQQIEAAVRAAEKKVGL